MKKTIVVLVVFVVFGAIAITNIGDKTPDTPPAPPKNMKDLNENETHTDSFETLPPEQTQTQTPLVLVKSGITLTETSNGDEIIAEINFDPKEEGKKIYAITLKIKISGNAEIKKTTLGDELDQNSIISTEGNTITVMAFPKGVEFPSRKVNIAKITLKTEKTGNFLEIKETYETNTGEGIIVKG